MQITNKKLTELTPYENNPRLNDPAVDAVAKSIKQFGFKVPMIITADGEIVAGHTRYKAAQALGLKEVPCVIADDLTPEQIKAFRLADNKVSELAEWDLSKLSEELNELAGMDFDMTQFGFDENFLGGVEDKEIIEDEIPEVDESKEPITKTGDIWQLGRHRLLCGDSTKKETVRALMGDTKADLLITDPPYNVNYEGKTKEKLKIQNDQMEETEFKDFLVNAFSAANEVMKPGAVFYIWHAGSEGYSFHNACKEVGWKVREVLIWRKWNHYHGLRTKSPKSICSRTRSKIL